MVSAALARIERMHAAALEHIPQQEEADADA
jgi:hypothetical protein